MSLLPFSPFFFLLFVLILPRLPSRDPAQLRGGGLRFLGQEPAADGGRRPGEQTASLGAVWGLGGRPQGSGMKDTRSAFTMKTRVSLTFIFIFRADTLIENSDFHKSTCEYICQKKEKQQYIT